MEEEVGSVEPEPIQEYVDTEITQKEEKKSSENVKEKRKKYKKPKRQASCLDIIFDIKALVLASHDRSRRYGVLLDRLHDCIILLILFLSGLTLICVAIFGVFGSPRGYKIPRPKYHLVDEDLMKGTNFIKHRYEGFSPHNGRFTFNMRMPFNSTMTGVENDIFYVEVSVRAKKEANANWVEVVRLHKNQRRLVCEQYGLYSYWIVEYSDGDFHRHYDYAEGPNCTVMTILYDNPTYKIYDVEVRIDPQMKILFDLGFVRGYVETWFEMNSESYTTFEWVLRLIFSIISAFYFLFFSITMIRSQKFGVWSTQQKWIALLLFELIFYHDPLYVADVFTGWYVFPIIETILSMTFVFTFLLYLLIFFHSLFKPPKDRTFFNFWLTKLLIILPMYVITMILFVASRLYDHADPSHDDIREVEFFYYLEIADTILFLIFFADLMYYIFKAIGNARRMRKHYSARFKIIGGLSFIVVLSFIGLTVSWGMFRFDSPGFQFLVSHSIILMYFGWLTIFFLPSTNIEENRPKVSKSKKKRLKKKYKSLDGEDEEFEGLEGDLEGPQEGETGGKKAGERGDDLEFGTVDFDQLQRDNDVGDETQHQRKQGGVDVLEMGENRLQLDEIQAETPKRDDSGSVEMKEMKMPKVGDDDLERRREEEEKIEEEMQHVFVEDEL